MLRGHLRSLVVRFGIGVASMVAFFVVFTLAKLVPFAVTVVGLAVFFLGILVLVPIVSPFGVSEQSIAAISGIGTLAGLWVIGLRVLFGVDVLGPLRKLGGTGGREQE